MLNYLFGKAAGTGAIKNRLLKSIQYFLNFLTNFMYQVNNVDFAFYSSIALMGPYRVEQLKDWRFVVDKSIALLLLS